MNGSPRSHCQAEVVSDAPVTTTALGVAASNRWVLALAAIGLGTGAASYINLAVIIHHRSLFVDQANQFTLLAAGDAVVVLAVVLALGVAWSAGVTGRRRWVERGLLGAVAVNYALQAAAASVMIGDFHAEGVFVATGAERILSWTGGIAGVVATLLVVIVAALAGAHRPRAEWWWRGAIVVASASALVGAAVRLSAALSQVTFTTTDETALGVTSIVTGALVALTTVRPWWWWRAGVGLGLVLTGVGFCQIEAATTRLSLPAIGAASGVVGAGTIVLAVTASACALRRRTT
jgi:hypothetical protein